MKNKLSVKELMKVADETRKRVSGYSPEKKAELLKEARRRVKKS
jgi:hypothetical protein